MCGIIGCVSRSASHQLNDSVHERLAAVLPMLEARGPDSQGICQDSLYALGHRRLAIIDPKSGAQPRRDPDSGAVIVYNGEVYNFHSLKHELEQLGCQFHTNCDTEVVLLAWRQWGEAAFARFNGFFALAIFDPAKQALILARDRLGIKPLFYRDGPDAVTFCSSIPPILALDGLDCRISLPAVSHFLTTGRVALGDQSLVDGVKLLPPGSWRRYDLGPASCQTRQYWSLPAWPAAEKASTSFADAVEEAGALLEDAVRQRLISDVPLGAFLSGGLDSSIIVDCAARARGDQPLPLFCAGSDDEALNEFKFARQVAGPLGCELEEIVIDAAEFARHWRHLVRFKGLPLSTPNEISIYQLASALRRQCTVTLTGEGADEIFGGYTIPQFSAYDFDRCARDPADVSPAEPFAMAMIMAHGRAFFVNDTDHYLSTSTWVAPAAKAHLLAPDAWAGLEGDREVFSFYEDFFGSIDGLSSFDKRMHLFTRYNLENLLLRIDSSTMAASVEARVPFTDHRLVELAFRLPDHFKMDWRDEAARVEGRELAAAQVDEFELVETKRLVRRAFADRLPEDVRTRKKMSFPVPFREWFSGPLAPEIEAICLESELAQTLFNPDAVERLLDSRAPDLWLVANLCLWWEEMRAPPDLA